MFLATVLLSVHTAQDLQIEILSARTSTEFSILCQLCLRQQRFFFLYLSVHDNRAQQEIPVTWIRILERSFERKETVQGLTEYTCEPRLSGAAWSHLVVKELLETWMQRSVSWQFSQSIWELPSHSHCTSTILLCKCNNKTTQFLYLTVLFKHAAQPIA